MTEQLMTTLSDEERERLMLMSEHAIAPPLSPAAQAVLNALLTTPVNSRQVSDGRAPQVKLAAALRACNDWRINTEFIDGVEYIRTTTLESIATELEGIN